MFIAEYQYSTSYHHFETAADLPQEGILRGPKGRLRFLRIHDGYAVYDSTLPTSGFVYPGTADDVFVPQTINHLPVTELRQTVFRHSPEPIAIEGGQLKRAYIRVGTSGGWEASSPASQDAEIAISFCGMPGQQIDLCSIQGPDRLILHVPRAREVHVSASHVQLRGSVPDGVETLVFPGRVFPFREPDWDMGELNNRCFEGLKRLRVIEGSLCGEEGWSFAGCTALERVHLADGMTRLPSCAFSGCGALQDLYIPDTVLDIGAYAFSGCTRLASIHLPSGLTRIAEGLFQDCQALKKVYLADTIETIEDYAFAGCVSLRRPWIPKGIRSIADTAFSAPQG